MIEARLSFLSFIKLLLENVPELKSVYDEHIDDYDEFLEHVLMGDVTRFAEVLYKNDPNSECLVRLLSFLDKAFLTKDKKLQELISVSFLENLSRDDECYFGIRQLLSDVLRQKLSLYESNM